MSRSLVSLFRKAGLAAAALALFVCSSLAFAGNEEVVGAWDVEMDFQGNKVPAKLTFAEKDGALTGTWEGRQGVNDLSNVKYEGGKLTFSRSVNFQGQEFDLNFDGKVEGGKLTGTFETPMGPLELTGGRPGAAAAGSEGAAEDMPTGDVNLPGSWHMVVSVADGSTSEGDLVFTDAEGKLTAVWTTDLGAATFNEVKVEGNNIAFAAEVDFGGTMVPLSFKGVTGGDKIKGTVSLTFDGQAMEMPVTGTKGGAAVEMLTGPVNLPGNWEVEASLPDGNTSIATFVIEDKDGKLVGKLSTEIGDATIDGIQVDGNKISYKGSIDMGGVAAPIEFEGSTGGDKMVGNFKLNMEGQEMALPVKGQKAMEVLTGEVNFPGEWEVEASLPDGNTSISTLSIVEKDGKLTGKMSTEIGDGAINEVVMDGNKFSFKCDIDMGGVAAPLTVTGSTGGDKLIGVAKLSMEGQEMDLPLKGNRAAAKPAGEGASN